jgi:hypothetical protein
MPNISIHLVPFLEILLAIVMTPAAGYYVWRGYRRRKLERLARGESRQPPLNP